MCTRCKYKSVQKGFFLIFEDDNEQRHTYLWSSSFSKAAHQIFRLMFGLRMRAKDLSEGAEDISKGNKFGGADSKTYPLPIF